jgi:hypothetical protein
VVTEKEKIQIELEYDSNWLAVIKARVAIHLKRLSELGDEL